MSVQVLQAGIGAPEVLILLLLLVFSAVIPLAVSVFVYRDAAGRNSDHALAWGMASFFGGLVVWLLYFVVRDEIGTGTPA